MSWKLQRSYEGRSFFEGFDFFNRQDPSNGAVTYVDRNTAFGSGLAFWTQSGIPGIQAEHWATLTPGQSRNSVRISSKEIYGGGLFLFDLALLPWGCGVWPAVWLLGQEKQWPYAGEIDVVEGVHEMSRNQMAFHTSPGCQISQDDSFSGTVVSRNCDASPGGRGCAISSGSDVSFGDGFNKGGGGVFALLWDGDGLKMWNWPRRSIPADISTSSPQPRFWGTPVAAVKRSGCDPYVYFKPATIILNVNLCGDWAGQSYKNSQCPGTCFERIANPANLVNTVMLINSIKVYQSSHETAGLSRSEANRNAGTHRVTIMRSLGLWIVLVVALKVIQDFL